MSVFRSVSRVGQSMTILAERGLSWLSGKRPPAPVFLRETFEKLGVSYIKLGQFIASSPSIFPIEYVQEFQKCLDQVPPISFDIIRKTIHKELGVNPDMIFESIDPNPLASASIAQVHSALLKNGKEVVLKVQKPGVRDVILTDLTFLSLSTRILETLAPSLKHISISDITTDMRSSMLEECDFVQEAKNIRDFRSFLAQNHIHTVRAPEVFEEYSNDKILVMERFYGFPLTDLDKLHGMGNRNHSSPASLLESALEVWFRSLRECSSFHADLHAGNLMILEDGGIGFVDFGMVGRISEKIWASLDQFLIALYQKDYTSLAESLANIGAVQNKVNTQEMGVELEKIFSSIYSARMQKLPK